jgi:hypothetical protein
MSATAGQAVAEAVLSKRWRIQRGSRIAPNPETTIVKRRLRRARLTAVPWCDMADA